MPKLPPPPDLVSTAQVAELYSCDTRTIHRWVDGGKLRPFIKSPGQTGGYLFERSEVERVRTALTAVAS